MNAVLKANGQRIMERIDRLAQFTEPGRPFTRRAFTDLYLEAREWLAGEFRAAHLDPRLDEAANLIGSRAGSDADLGTLMLGSHIDTVAGGGRFDGIAGVVCALEVAQLLAEAGISLRHPLAVVDFLSEEPSDYLASCVGSSAMVGALAPAELLQANPQGETLAAAILRMGGRPHLLGAPLIAGSGIAAFLELHIEQGPVLEAQGRQLGIVTGIAGIRRLQVTITGKAAHAGTTPMHMRSDALVGAARLVELVWQRAGEQAQQLPFVATIGSLQVFPGGANVVPGRVELVLEARSLDAALTADWLKRLTDEAAGVLDSLGLQFSATEGGRAPAVDCDPGLRGLLAAACGQRGIEPGQLTSGAGHDAMHLAAVTKVAMLFVPCKDGVSHNPAESAGRRDLEVGAEVLLDTVLALDRLVEE